MQEIFISFIIPCFHSEDTINNALQSIFAAVEKYVPFEIVLVSQNEDDGTFAAVDDTYKSVINFYHSYYPGVTANRNTGLKNAKGKYVYFLDSDDVLVSEDWKNVIERINNNDTIDVFFGRTKNFNESAAYFDNHLGDILETDGQLDAFYGDGGLVSFSYCSYVFKKEFLVDNNIYVSENIKNAEDYLFVGLVLTKHPKVIVMTYYLNEYIKRESSLSNAFNLQTALSYVDSFKLLFELLDTNRFINSLIRFRLNFVCVNMDIGCELNGKDKSKFIKHLKKKKIKNEIVKCPRCRKRTMYLLFGYRLTWIILKTIHKIKGID